MGENTSPLTASLTSSLLNSILPDRSWINSVLTFALSINEILRFDAPKVVGSFIKPLRESDDRAKLSCSRSARKNWLPAQFG